MNLARRFIVFLAASILMTSAYPETLKKVYLDSNRNIHIINDHGIDKQITNKGNAGPPKLAPDRKTVAWLVMNTWMAEGDDGAGSEELTLYRDGKINSLKCTPFIRDYWFWMNGNQIAIDCGSRHFAGRETLYDTRTMRGLSSFDEAKVPLENRPDWSGADN
ncbi:hypothetical protein [Massilia luteola]|uniref:hypothetical protein n=1 Tax=Massilia luteola TaxID=3081751 RepID=UPI002ACC2261|nr:hypothetical protein [Massilia sp. Gc5]